MDDQTGASEEQGRTDSTDNGPRDPDPADPVAAPQADALAPDATDTDRHLLELARELATLDLAERPDAFERLDSAIMDELQAIEDL